MHWVEICNDGGYEVDGEKYRLLADDIQPLEVEEFERAKDDSWVKYTHPFCLETEHGEFHWDVDLIEYVEPAGATLLGFTMTRLPPDVVLTEEISFRLHDGWP
ncbi:hypothetical protein QS468_47930 [Bacillus subtilis]|nr:hypothetical protein [Pseudomonas sp. A29(2023)]MDL5600511.1 hypothetical protein [Bacillus subtilis]